MCSRNAQVIKNQVKFWRKYASDEEIHCLGTNPHKAMRVRRTQLQPVTISVNRHCLKGAQVTRYPVS